jgi:hypothetical protein
MKRSNWGFRSNDMTCKREGRVGIHCCSDEGLNIGCMFD